MFTRNALAIVVATALTAVAASAQQPAKPAPSTTHSATTHAQAPAAAKKSGKTTSAQAVAVNADSAKKILMANASGATVTSEKLHHSGGKAYYAFSYKMKGSPNTMHASVDANTGAFEMTAPQSAPTKSSTAPKKPS